MKRRALVASALLLTLLPSARAVELEKNPIDLVFESSSIQKSLTLGGNSRGPAIAVMQDDTVLLGGGANGGEVFIWNKQNKTLVRGGSFIPAQRRDDDSRFAINDIAVL